MHTRPSTHTTTRPTAVSREQQRRPEFRVHLVLPRHLLQRRLVGHHGHLRKEPFSEDNGAQFHTMSRVVFGAGSFAATGFLGYSLNNQVENFKSKLKRHRQLSCLEIKTLGEYFHVDIDANYPPRSKGICDNNRQPKPQGPRPELSLTDKLENPLIQGMGMATTFFTSVFFISGPGSVLRTFFGTFALGSAVVSAGMIHFTPSHEDHNSSFAAFRTRLITAPVTVIRHGKQVKVTGNDVNVGELIVLTAGSIAPGDLRVVHVTNPRTGLHVQAYRKDGDTPAVVHSKNATTVSMADTTTLIDRADNIISAGHVVVSGGGLAMVYAKGNNTFSGATLEIAQYLDQSWYK